MTMQRYIAQLIDDIRQATWNVRPPHELWEKSKADPLDELELEDMSHAEQYIYGEKQPIALITGIEHEHLPPPEKLTEEQKTLLATELGNLLQFFHFYLDFPETFPAHLRYPFIRNFWSESQVPLSFGENHIEFCDYVEETCPFPGYCTTCKEIAEQMKYDEEKSKENNPDFDISVNDLLPGPKQIEEWKSQQNILDENNDRISLFHLGDDNKELEYNEEINGLYNDDGTKINPLSVPVPGLCLLCKKYQSDDWEENILCLLNRNSQRDESDFKCGAFDKFE